MKNFLFALLVLAGCASAPVQPLTPKEDPAPTIITLGANGKMSWSCQVEELNDKLVWIPCSFHNESEVETSTCIQVSFYTESAGVLVAKSRKVCSGLVSVYETQTNYAAFIKEKRQALQRCGEQLNLCVMLADVVQK